MRFGSLFAGVGGFDLAFERAGMECAFQSEIDPHCLQVLEKHWPEVERLGSITELTWRNTPAVAIIVGGFPCQDLSVAGHRKGLAGGRSGLFYEFMRLVDEAGPRWVVIENVPGLLSSNGGRDMGAVLGTLAELRYGYAYRVLDAQFFGVPQRRRRVFIVGCTGGRYPVEALFESESLRGSTPPRRETGEGIASTLATSAGQHGPRGDGSDNLVVFDPNQITNPVNRSSVTPGQPSPTLSTYGSAPVVMGATATGIGYWREGQRPLAASDDNGTNHVVAFNWQSGGDCRLGLVKDGSPSLHAGQTPAIYPAPMPRVGDYAFTMPPGIRRLTPRECERLQGFPDDWTAGHADSHRYRMMGNAVAVPVVQWIATRLRIVDAKCR